MLEERRGALEQVVGREDAVRRVELGRQPGVDVGLHRQVDEALGLADGQRPARGDLLADGCRSSDRLPGRHDLVDQTDPLGLLGGQDLAGQDQLLGPSRPDHSRQALGAAGTGRDRKPHFRQPEPGSLRRDPEVAAERQFQPAAEGVAFDGGDRRHRQFGQAARDAGLELVTLATAGAALLLELADVRTGGEGALAAAGHDDRTDVAGGRGGQDGQCGGQLVEERSRDQVQRRVVELETGDAAELERDELAHDAAPKSAASPIGPVA